jgi:hydroxymethylbilane synthase
VNTSRAVPARLVIASRESALALWQAEFVRAQLAELYPRCRIEILGMTTSGDKLATASLAQYGGKGLFVKELEQALAEDKADLAVHSMKDVPMELPPGFELTAILKRDDPRDAFISNRYSSLEELLPGARIGTSSLRRESQLKHRYPHVEIMPLRGNVGTRLAKLDAGGYDGIILAAAGLKRLGLGHRITRVLEPDASIPAPGQGALGIEILSARESVAGLIAPLADRQTTHGVRAERAFSAALAGSCNVPLGAYGEVHDSELRLLGFVASVDGARMLKDEIAGEADKPEVLGAQLAERLKAQGAAALIP